MLAGPGAGKTFCLTERIRHLIQHHGVDPARILAFTFTNKAAGEITQRLETLLGAQIATAIESGTIHAFCANLLRKHGSYVALDQAFGIADEEYQLNVLRRIRGPRPWYRSVLTRFSGYRFRGDTLQHDDLVLLYDYEKYLGKRNVVDFDMLVLKAADLIEKTAIAASIRGRYDVILVDEFQDLNPVQYRVVRALACEHQHVFAVGDHEQSIYSWAGADKRVFTLFLNDFGLVGPIHLEENRRCPNEVFALARKLVTYNTPIFADAFVPRTNRDSPFPVRAFSFATDEDEAGWIVRDVLGDRESCGHRWGDIALLYRKHDIGALLESTLINAGVPCLLPRGRALGDDPAIEYVIAAARVIAWPKDDVLREELFRVILPTTLFDEALAKAVERGVTLRRQLEHLADQLPRADESGRQIRRALADWRNLQAISKQHQTLTALVQELLSRRVGRIRSVLDDRHDEISDPASLEHVVRLAERLRNARTNGRDVWVPPMDGVDIPLKGMLNAIGMKGVRGHVPPSPQAMTLDLPGMNAHELPLALFKAAQLIELDVVSEPFMNFTAIDIETTDDDAETADVVEIAAVRVRNGKIEDTFWSLVKPGVAISEGAFRSHGITEGEVAGAPVFADVWPRFRDFCGSDVVVAHNGHDFDFEVLRRLVVALGERFRLTLFDTLPMARDLFQTSRKLVDLARYFEIPTGRSHRGLDDSLTLARVYLALGEMKQVRTRKTALVTMLDHLGVALALCDEKMLSAEAQLFRGMARPFALGRYSDCLGWYERELGDSTSVPSVEELIERLGGVALMTRIRAEKSADERYPVAMQRLRRLIAGIPGGALHEQLPVFLERVVLSRWDGHEADPDRVNLLTLHSTKGLEFSRVYIVGTEDGQLPGIYKTPPSDYEIEEARRLLYVGMTRTIDRLVLTRTEKRGEQSTGGHRFLDEMGAQPQLAKIESPLIETVNEPGH